MLFLSENLPMLEVVIESPLKGRRYPDEGVVLALLDTGYEGFLLVPPDLFETLFEGIEPERRTLLLADGRLTESIGTYGLVSLPDLGREVEGFVETAKGVDEIVAGLELASEFRIILDYCTGTAVADPCPKPA